jgi:predicted MFS family arabinose efflux permease
MLLAEYRCNSCCNSAATLRKENNMKAEHAVLAVIAVILAAGYYGLFAAITSIFTYFTYSAPSLTTQVGIALAIPAVYLLVFGRGINLGTVTQVEP